MKQQQTKACGPMASSLLKINDGEMTVCLEYGDHAELNMPVVDWLTIYKRDAAVSLTLAGHQLLTGQNVMALLGRNQTELGTRLLRELDDGRVAAEPVFEEDGVFRGSMLLRNAVTVLKSKATAGRHRLVLSLAELCSLERMVSMLLAFDEVSSLGLVQLGCGRKKKQSASADETFRFAGDLYACEFTPTGRLAVEPFLGVFYGDNAEAKAWAAKHRLWLTSEDAHRLRRFNALELEGKGLSRDGRIVHVNEQRSIGIFRSQRYFPETTAGSEEEEEVPMSLLPFTPTDWRWLCACLWLYTAMVDYHLACTS